MSNLNITNSEQLVPIFNAKIGGIGVAACDARALHTYLESGYLFANWIKDRIEKYEFLENKDFILIFQNPKIKSSHGGDRRSKDYHLTLDMAKELAMVENNAKGREVRRYFIECERRWHERPLDYYSDLLTIAEATQSLANTVRSLIDKYANHDTNEIEANSLTCPHIVNCEQRTQPQLPNPIVSTLAITSPVQPCADSIFLSVLQESLESQPLTANQLYLIIVARQYPALTDAAVNLLGDMTTWSARKLGQTLGRWSRSEFSCYRILNIGSSKNGILWRLERVS